MTTSTVATLLSTNLNGFAVALVAETFTYDDGEVAVAWRVNQENTFAVDLRERGDAEDSQEFYAYDEAEAEARAAYAAAVEVLRGRPNHAAQALYDERWRAA